MTSSTTTVFVSSLNGQYRIWDNDIKDVCRSSDTTVVMGNMVNIDSTLCDKGVRTPNQNVCESVTDCATTNNVRILVGPHEMMALNNPGVWTNDFSDDIIRTLWLDTDQATVALSHHGRLVTHGGMTYGEWLSIGEPNTAEEAAQRLNDKYAGTLYQGPSMALGDSPSMCANPVWADVFTELYPSWILAPKPCPFDQVHASGDVNTDEGREAIKNPHSLLYYMGGDNVEYKKYGSVVSIKGASFTGVDLQLHGTLMSSLLHSGRDRALYVEKVEN